MKASFEQLSDSSNSSIFFKQLSYSYFDAPFHFHPEFELTLIVKSEGKRFVGTNVADFQAGDLVLLGPNVPHCWKNDGIGPEDSSQAIVIQFKEEVWGEMFFKNQETEPIRILLEKAKQGLQITGKTRDRIAKEMVFLLNVPPFQRMLGLLDLLNTIAISNDLKLIESEPKQFEMSAVDLDRINKIYAYVIENYTQELHLETAAHLASMTETAFCRYFKKITKKTFLDLVTEYRIKHACNLLANSEKQVAEVCFESGFGNISHFNKQFKQVTGQSPLGYRKVFLAKAAFIRSERWVKASPQ
ncbi:AraC family transcriptional regulator [Arcicella lustrica]|uniref:AraC family transcriptional regulator n=1 Tax=Arcicella lustrica TaxID=2984196 RepID=A0ABU5SI08_9BACT|nr:AraC family transcriptional regulator [Arcicella sp. DC25W]MEA5426927.1 AraC family transcriptional regulator [Arcicella sp. DC25W]